MGVFLGVDWAEDHHDLCLLDADGRVLAARRIPEGIDGVGVCTRLVASHIEDPEDPAEVTVGIETDRGLLVGSLVAAGYEVYAISPLAASRYRDRHATSRAKSDKGDAKMLADLVRTDRHNHRPVAADTELLEAIRVLARSHQNLIWTRQRQTNQLRSTLREYYPAALAAFDDLAHPDALAVLAKAPTPELGRRLSTSQIRSALKAAGRQRNLDRRAQQIRDALRAPQLEAAPLVADAYGTVVAALVPIINNLSAQTAAVEANLIERFEHHPDAELLLRLPGLSFILAARVLTEFGDAPNRYADAKTPRNYAGTAPITRASGTSEVVLARMARNRRLFDACYQWAFCALTPSPGARAYYDAHNPGPRTGKTARRKLANNSSASSHGTLTHRTNYDHNLAWQHWQPDQDQLAA